MPGDPPEEIGVLVVGRGPTGMTTALRLAALGVPSTVVDGQPADSVEPGSKAVLLAGHVIEVTEPFGVGQQIAAEGLAWTTGRTFVRGKEVKTAHLPAGEGLLPRVVNLPQQRVEELLLARLRSEPLVTLVASATVTGLETDGDAVTATWTGPDGEHRVRARWVVGCDGSRSTVRRALGIPFTGYGHDDTFLIADIAARLPFPDERHLHFDPPYNRGRTVLVHPQPHGTWHIDWQVGPEVDAAEERANGGLDRRLRALIGSAPYELHWATTYRFKQLRAQRFRQGRAFLVGDAAHLTSPYGARGMNSGMADAENLAWRLGFVVRGWSRPSLLDGYAREREPAAEENLRITGRTARFMCPRTRRDRLRQRLVLAAAHRSRRFGRLVDSGTFYAPPSYPSSRASADGVPPGRLAPDAPVHASVPGVRRLGQLLRSGVALLWFPGTAEPDLPAVAERVRAALPPGLPLRVIAVGSGEATGDLPPGLVRLEDGGRLARDWCPRGVPPGGRVYVIRPDAYVAAVLDPAGKDPAPAVTSQIVAAFDLSVPEGARHERTSHPQRQAAP